MRGGSRARITARPFGRERRARNGERKEMTLTRGSGRAARGKETRARAGQVGREAQRGSGLGRAQGERRPGWPKRGARGSSVPRVSALGPREREKRVGRE